jgi:hypothetical protein
LTGDYAAAQHAQAMDDVATINQSWIQHHPPQLWAVVLAALVLAWPLGLVVYRLSKVGGLNKDPLQHELAHLIIAMMVCGAAQEAQLSFVVSSRNQFTKAMVSDPSKQQKRLAHALTMARPTLGRAGYERARSIIREIT